MQVTLNVARKYGAKLVAGTLATLGAASVFAQTTTNPFIEILDSISLAGVAAAVLALMVIVVAIAMTMQGGTVAKRVVRKV